MAFTDKKNLRERGGGIAGVAIVHVGMAALLIFGLTTEVTKVIFSGPMPSREYKDPIPPPPNPQTKQNESPTDSIITAPLPPKPVPDAFVFTVDPIKDFTESNEVRPVPLLDPSSFSSVGPAIAASPRNNAATWVTDNDYRTIWINREMYGSASFRLDVATNGKVDSCRITRSTGHTALDQATCDLIAKRARFNPAKDGAGIPVAGSYSGSINWVLPD